MNKRDHVINAVLLSVGISVLLSPPDAVDALVIFLTIAPPVILGALLPDLDTVFGVHRKTFHNVWVLGFIMLFPLVFGNLYYVWIGVLTHFTLDLLGNRYGMGLLYPLPGFYDIPVGVNVDSRLAGLVTLLVTAVELVFVYLIVAAGLEAHLAAPELVVFFRALLGPIIGV